MLNKVMLIGNLTRDVELRFTQGGLAIGGFGLAVNRKWKDRNTGEQREDTMFIDVDVFGESAKTAKQYISKGRQVLVEGRLVFDQWTDQNGQKRSRHKIAAENLQFLGGGRGENQHGGDGYEDKGGYGDRGGYESKEQNAANQPAGKKEPAREPDQNSADQFGDEVPF